MADEIARMKVTLDASTARLDRAVDRAERNLRSKTRRMTTSARRLDNTLSTVGGQFGLRLSGQAALATAALAGVSLAVRSIVKEGDQVRRLEGRFRALTGSASRAETAMQEIFRIAQSAGVPIDAVANSLTRFTLAATDLGKSDQEVARFTETLLKLGALGGSTAAEISSAMLQLSQGLGKGTLDGEELKAVLESMPLAGRAIAEGMGVAYGSLRELGKEGELTAERVFGALARKAGEVDAMFASMPPNLEIASGRLAVAWSKFASELDDSLGISERLVAKLEQAANHLAGIGDGLRRAQAAEQDNNVKYGVRQADGSRVRLPTGFLDLNDPRGVGGDASGMTFPAFPHPPRASWYGRGGRPPSRRGRGAGAPGTSPAPRAAPFDRNAPDPAEIAARAEALDRLRDNYDRVAASIGEEARALDFEMSLAGKAEEVQGLLRAEREHDQRVIELQRLASEAKGQVDQAEIDRATALSERLRDLQVAREEQIRLEDKQREATERAAQAMEGFANRLSGAIGNARSLNDMLKNLALTLANEALTGLFHGKGVFGQMLGSFLTGAAGGVAGGAAGGGGSLGSVMGFGARATGGRVSARMPYLTGERGPEPFIPDAPGRILSHADAMAAASGGGRGGPSVEQHFHFSGGVDAATRAAIRREILPEAAMAAMAAVADERRRGGNLARALK